MISMSDFFLLGIAGGLVGGVLGSLFTEVVARLKRG